MNDIAQSVAAVRLRIAEACKGVGRDPASVRLVCVTKFADAEAIRAAFAAGCREMGESRIVPAERKLRELGDLPVSWHGIGTIQTNKAGKAVRIFDLIHSVHSLHTAEALSAAAKQVGKRQDVLLQVNVSREGQKHGVEPEDMEEAAAAVADLPGVRLLGLMTMAPLVQDPEETRPFFRLLRQLRDRLAKAHPEAVELSMGMTQDYPVAVEEGATLVRVGSAIFAPTS